jgi:hypothetical protein
VVVSEETGSISLAERGILNKPLTSSKLKELLEARFSPAVEREAVAPSIRGLVNQIGNRVRILMTRFFALFGLNLPASPRNKK